VSDKSFNCTVLTPERAVLKTTADFVAIPAHDGEIGILRDRAPLLCRLGIGIVRMETDQGQQRLFVDSGFAEVRDNQLTILTEDALLPDQVNIEAEKAAQAAAEARQATTEEEHEARQQELARTNAKLKLAGRG
jgi:F-type H+-transporting ATPase subunit epsilon